MRLYHVPLFFSSKDIKKIKYFYALYYTIYHINPFNSESWDLRSIYVPHGFLLTI